MKRKIAGVAVVLATVLAALTGVCCDCSAANLGNIMPLGDSITQGVLPGGYREPLLDDLTNAGDSLTFIGSLNTESTPELVAAGQEYHEGHYGYQIEDVGAGVATWFSADPVPNYILLMIGTNDFQGYPATESGAINQLDALIGDITSLCPSAHLIVSNLTLRGDANEEADIEALFNPFVPGVVEAHAALGENVSFVDMHSVLGPSDLLDRAHPNASGNLKLGAAWAAAIEAVARALPGDANLDGRVDVNDLTIVLTHFDQTGMFWGQGDFNGDGKVDVNDLVIVLTSLGRTCGASSGIDAVPEPTTIILLLASAACLVAFAWRRRSSRKIIACLAVLAMSLSTTVAHAQVSNVFNMPNGEASLQFVTVGDPGNTPNDDGYGSVPYVYQMGKYDVGLLPAN